MERNYLIIGTGAREHAMGWLLLKSPHVGRVEFALGNGGTANIRDEGGKPRSRNIHRIRKHNLSTGEFSEKDYEELAKYAADTGKTVLPLMEDDLAAGVVDICHRHKARVYGPTRAQSQWEWSKIAWAQYADDKHIAQPKWEGFDRVEDALKYVESSKKKLIAIKADGLCRGKGVVVTNNPETKEEAVRDLMERRIHGRAGDRIIIQEGVKGREFSAVAMFRGRTFRRFPLAVDYKLLNGRNTGGMGAYAPAFWVGEDEEKIIDQNFKKMRPFYGFAFPGYILTDSGLLVLEFNGRLPDPEFQTMAALLRSDFSDAIENAINGMNFHLQFMEGSAVALVMASKGYPAEVEDGKRIRGLKSNFDEGVNIFYAGTVPDNHGLVTKGGRVLTITASAPLKTTIEASLSSAREKVYDARKLISFEGAQSRDDIADFN